MRLRWNPYETFYQRTLEGHAMDLLPGARQRIAASSLTEYYDTVALPGLALAQRDLSRDVLAFERLEEIHLEIDALLERLADLGRRGRREACSPGRTCCRRRGANAPSSAFPGAVTSTTSRPPWWSRSLEGAGFGARLEHNAVLGPSSSADLGGTRLCCLSIIEEGSSVSGIRYFVRRIRKRMPQAAIVIGLWRADRDSPVLAALRAEGTDEHLVLSIGELLAFSRALSVQVAPTELADAPDVRRDRAG